MIPSISGAGLSGTSINFMAHNAEKHRSANFERTAQRHSRALYRCSRKGYSSSFNSTIVDHPVPHPLPDRVLKFRWDSLGQATCCFTYRRWVFLLSAIISRMMGG